MRNFGPVHMKVWKTWDEDPTSDSLDEDQVKLMYAPLSVGEDQIKINDYISSEARTH